MNYLKAIKVSASKSLIAIFIAFLQLGVASVNAQTQIYECVIPSENNSASGRVITLRVLDSSSNASNFGSVGKIPIIEKSQKRSSSDWEGKLENGLTIAFRDTQNLPGYKYALEIKNAITGGTGLFVCKEKTVTESIQKSDPQLTITTLKINQSSTSNDQIDKIKSLLITPTSPDVIESTRKFEAEIISTRKFEGAEVNLINDYRYLRLQKILLNILNANGIDSTKWQLRLLDSNPQIENAFVTGGTTVFVFTGISENAKSDDELAFILGHEIAHTLLKHRTRVDNEFATLFSTITAAAAVLSKQDNTRERLQFASNLVSSSYSRDHEREADTLGIFLATKAGYDTSFSIQFFQRAQQLENKSRTQDELTINQYIQQANQLADSCDSQKKLYYSSPNYQTKQNALIVNNVCNQAADLAQTVNKFMKDYYRNNLKSMMTRTHPIDNQRIRATQRVTSYIRCQIGEDKLDVSSSERNVISALHPFRACK